jgi:hypothetical protein
MKLPAQIIAGEWYLPVGDFHEMRYIAADALRLLGDNEWTPEQLDDLHRRYSDATGGERP